MAELTALPAPVVTLKNVSLSHGRGGQGTPVLTGITLSLRRGEFVAVLGPSGAGKSTLLRIVMGLLKPGTGTVELSGTNGKGRRIAALVFQDAKLLPWRRVLGNVTFGLEGLGLSLAEREARARAALALVGLAEHAERWPRELSGGQRQRVGVARALTVDPDLLLMDEPFGALDAITRSDLQEELLRIWQQTGKTVLFVTHDIDEALLLADRVIVLGGKPATIRSDLVVGPRPRDRGDPRMAQLVLRLRALIAGDRAPPPDGWIASDI
ncbi:MAG: ABC transporter ATP-binding protein [Azospirillaceae bacterium]|nr:ABC transporter ATP-binding protein [Azospirillaceae bacterium]